MKRLANLALLLVFCLVILAAAAPAGANCYWYCKSENDVVACERGAVSDLAAQECRVTTNCQLTGFKDGGNGTYVPYYTCTEGCDMTWCVWA